MTYYEVKALYLTQFSDYLGSSWVFDECLFFLSYLHMIEDLVKL